MSNETRVLLAEDDGHIAKLISFKLKKEGFSITWATDGHRALTSGLSEKWDVIVLDVMMPHLTGWQVLQAVRSAGIKTPVLMLTAKGEESDVIRAKKLGATHFLKKPFDPSELVRVLRQMMSDPEMAQMTEEFVASFTERLEALERSLTSIASQPIEAEFSEQNASALHITSHTLAGVAANFGFSELGSIAARVEDALLKAIGHQIGSSEVLETVRLANELKQALEAARVPLTSSEESPASEAKP
jgi:DNA-binding response OmpR family regulator